VLYSFINVDIFIIYCCFESFSNFILETLHNLNVVFRKYSYTHIDKNNIVLLYKLLIVIEFLI